MLAAQADATSGAVKREYCVAKACDSGRAGKMDLSPMRMTVGVISYKWWAASQGKVGFHEARKIIACDNSYPPWIEIA